MYLSQRSKSLKDTFNCEPPEPANTLTSRLNTLLSSSGPGYTLSLCPREQYYITAPLAFAAPNQEISTAGYPTGSDRATLVINGPVSNGTGHTTAVDGTCANCDGVKLCNLQINGARLDGPPIPGTANIEMGGSNADQVIEYVHSFDPRSWSCLHVAEGNLDCNNVTVQHNDIGPAGSDLFEQWADGISFACRNSLVRNNMINNPTDGGIVLFGAPGTRVENNTIWVEKKTLLGGINMVDYLPYDGDYSGVVVANNTIAGAFASEPNQVPATKGTNNDNAIIKIGVAIGPRTWFGNEYGHNVSTGAIVQDNQFTGAFSYAIAISSATNFTIKNNVLTGNTSFIGTQGPRCTSKHPSRSPAAFVVDSNTTRRSTIQSNFASVSDVDHLICVLPPDGGDYWPFGTIPNPSPPSIGLSKASTTIPTTNPSRLSTSMTTNALIGDLLLVAAFIYLLWIRGMKRSRAAKSHSDHLPSFVIHIREKV